jgi:broad specificity phosphatase PhoE
MAKGVPLLLLRHAHAGDRHDWDGPDDIRPLSLKGWRQARGLVDLLSAYPITRILSSPFVRCLQTVEELAANLGIEIEPVSELSEEADYEKTVALIRELGGSTPVLCTHGDVIPEVLETLEVTDGLDLPPRYRYAKGSTWVLEYRKGRFERAQYLPPPA